MNKAFNEKELGALFDKLSDHDKRIVGMLGISFLLGLFEKVKKVLHYG